MVSFCSVEKLNDENMKVGHRRFLNISKYSTFFSSLKKLKKKISSFLKVAQEGGRRSIYTYTLLKIKAPNCTYVAMNKNT